MKNKILLLLIHCLLFLGCHNKQPTSSTNIKYGTVELVMIPMVGEKALLLDSMYTSPSGNAYSVKALRFFLSDIAVARSTGMEYKASDDVNKSGVYLCDFNKANFDAGFGKQSYKVSFKVPVGDYSDIRYTIGVPRELNHSDPATASGALNLGQAAEMYWEWNSGYIFFLAEGKIHQSDNKLFHFAIGQDARVMPLSFGNLFEIEPLLKIEEGKTTRITFILDFNKLLMNGDKTFYSLQTPEKSVVHGGYYADVLRNNLLRAIKIGSVENNKL